MRSRLVFALASAGMFALSGVAEAGGCGGRAVSVGGGGYATSYQGPFYGGFGNSYAPAATPYQGYAQAGQAASYAQGYTPGYVPGYGLGLNPAGSACYAPGYGTYPRGDNVGYGRGMMPGMNGRGLLRRFR